MSGPLSNNSSNGALAVLQQHRLSGEQIICMTPLRSAIPKNGETINTWPASKDLSKCHSHSEGQESKHTTNHSLSNIFSRQEQHDTATRHIAVNTHPVPFAESRLVDFGYRHAKEKPIAVNTPMREPKSEIARFTEKLDRLAAEQSPSDTQLSLKSGGRSGECECECKPFCVCERKQPEEDLRTLDSKLGNQFDRLMSAIDGVTKQMQTAFEGLHERVDGLQASLEADYEAGWKKLKDHLDQQGTPESGVRKRGAHMLRSVDSLNSLEEATETAREDIRILTGLLIVEKDADLMFARDFQDRQVMMLKMMEPYLKKPAFEQFWHLQHGLEHCVASVLFRTSNVLARTQSVTGSGSGSNFPVDDDDEAQFKRFCRKGQKSVEAIASWEDGKWSAQLRKEFLNACKVVWQLQSMIVKWMNTHQVEFLRPELGARLDEATMDPLDCLSEDRFERSVQFTIFPGLKINDSVLIKSQVYLQPKCPWVTTT